MKSEIVQTADGSSTIFLPEIGEHYHSTYGAVQESMHVFLSSGLEKCSKTPLTIFEVGFGTGLNALLTADSHWAKEKKIHYITVEKYPVSETIWQQLQFPSGEPSLFEALHRSVWEAKTPIHHGFDLQKLQRDLLTIDFRQLPLFDLIYFDAFSPDKQPELWSLAVFEKLYRQCNPEAVLVTYCAKGQVRRNMQQAGFVAERLPGPPGKREMLRGVKR